MAIEKVLAPFVIGAAVLLALLLMLFAVPAMIQQVVGFQLRIGNGHHPLVRFLVDHRDRVVLVWRAVYVVGLLIALPTMIRDGFFTPDAVDAAAGAARPRGGPAAAQPSLEYQIDAAPIIVLASTVFYGEEPFYRVSETWKATVP